MSLVADHNVSHSQLANTSGTSGASEHTSWQWAGDWRDYGWTDRLHTENSAPIPQVSSTSAANVAAVYIAPAAQVAPVSGRPEHDAYPPQLASTSGPSGATEHAARPVQAASMSGIVGYIAPIARVATMSQVGWRRAEIQRLRSSPGVPPGCVEHKKQFREW